MYLSRRISASRGGSRATAWRIKAVRSSSRSQPSGSLGSPSSALIRTRSAYRPLKTAPTPRCPAIHQGLVDRQAIKPARHGRRVDRGFARYRSERNFLQDLIDRLPLAPTGTPRPSATSDHAGPAPRPSRGEKKGEPSVSRRWFSRFMTTSKLPNHGKPCDPFLAINRARQARSWCREAETGRPPGIESPGPPLHRRVHPQRGST